MRKLKDREEDRKFERICEGGEGGNEAGEGFITFCTDARRGARGKDHATRRPSQRPELTFGQRGDFSWKA